MAERVTEMLTTTTDDNEFILSQELCLETESRIGGPGNGVTYSGHDTSRKRQVENEKEDKEAGREKDAA